MAKYQFRSGSRMPPDQSAPDDQYVFAYTITITSW